MKDAFWDFVDWANEKPATPFVALAVCFALTCFALWLGGQTW